MMVRPNKKVGFIPPIVWQGGFTLVELLIATGVTVIIVVLLGTMLGSFLSTASRATQRIDAFREARAALQMMERDLSNLVRAQWNPDPFSNPAPLPCAASTTSTTSVTRPAAYFAAAPIWQDPNDPYSGGNPNAQIFALISTKSAGSATAGDVCAVGYYCRWDGNRYTLRRFFRDSAHTFSVLQSAASYALASDLYDLNAADARNDLLAAYVWNFKVAMYDASGNLQTTYPCLCDQPPATPTMLPAAIEISFNAMSSQAARTVMSVTSDPNDWMTPTQNYQRLVSPHTYQFRTRINFQ
jgi:type II secretory pathway pseudopilin PulG